MPIHLLTAVLAVAIGQAAPADDAPTTPEAATPPAARRAVKPSKPAPPKTAAETKAQAAMARFMHLDSVLKEGGHSLAAKNRLKRQVAFARTQAREAIQAVQYEQAQKEEQAYLRKMMPIWEKQRREDAQFSIEVAKAQALQQMAITAERRRQDDLWLQYQRNQIMTDEAQSLRRMAQ